MSEVSLDFYKQPKVTQVFEKTIHLIKLNAIKSVCQQQGNIDISFIGNLAMQDSGND